MKLEYNIKHVEKRRSVDKYENKLGINLTFTQNLLKAKTIL